MLLVSAGGGALRIGEVVLVVHQGVQRHQSNPPDRCFLAFFPQHPFAPDDGFASLFQVTDDEPKNETHCGRKDRRINMRTEAFRHVVLQA